MHRAGATGPTPPNPMAMILAATALLGHAGEEGQQALRARSAQSALEAAAKVFATADLGGHAGTPFTDEVIRRTKSKLEVWSTVSAVGYKSRPMIYASLLSL